MYAGIEVREKGASKDKDFIGDLCTLSVRVEGHNTIGYLLDSIIYALVLRYP
jgi:hypothetical protein